MKVATNDVNPNEVLTYDEQGLVTRTVSELIVHASNRYVCKHGGPFFFPIHHNNPQTVDTLDIAPRVSGIFSRPACY
jgi:hypothetical protein